MAKKEIDVKWEDFSLFGDSKIPKQVYNSVVIVDLKGKNIQFDGRFSLLLEGDKIVAKAERSP